MRRPGVEEGRGWDGCGETLLSNSLAWSQKTTKSNNKKPESYWDVLLVLSKWIISPPYK